MTKNIVGLTNAEAEKSREVHGSNSLMKVKTKGIFRKYIENLSDPIIKILLISLVIEIVVTLGNCDFFEISGILVAIIIATTVSTVSECGSEAAFKRIEAESQDTSVRVMRDGIIQNIKASDIVVDDIVYLYAGEKIYADGIIIEGTVSVNQAALNGEGAEVTKRAGKAKEPANLSDNISLFSGSLITDGSGIMKVNKVGINTYYGQVARDVQTETRESPLKLRLGKLASQISKLGYVMAALVGITYLFNTLVIDNGFVVGKILEDIKNYKYFFEVIIHAMTLMITVIVVSTPEGLPMMITVVLSANMKKMLRDNILVKKLVGIETAGSMNILFSDKTGTITSGRLAVDKVITAEECIRNTKTLRKHKTVYKFLKLSADYNTDTVKIGNEITGGNATDRAISEFFIDGTSETLKIKNKLPFKSDNKYSSVTFNNGFTLFKGAAEVILEHCKYILDESGERLISDFKFVKSEYKKRISNGERVIGIAFSDNEEMDNLVFVALIALKDKIRANAEHAIKKITSAGIQVVMITGDGKDTACAIAEECGILTNKISQIAITSKELATMSDEKVMEILPKLRVVARALPRDKMRLVELAQKMNLVVGMTGDGINDAPSLKLADIGFSMGSGTDIAKAASDVVLLDDSIDAIGKTALYGRTIFKSIRKFITFQLIMNIAACGVSLVGQFVGIDNPITIIQMLWINIIMDTLGGLAFAGEAALDYYMKEKPKAREEPILSRDMMNQIIFTGMYTLGLCVSFLCSGFFRNCYGYSLSSDKFFTAFYALFIFSGIFNCFAARCERLFIMSNISKNKAFMIIMLFISLIQIGMIYFGGSVFRCTPLTVRELFAIILLAFTVIPFDIIRRIFYKLK